MDYFYILIINIINTQTTFRVQAGPPFADLLLERNVTAELFTFFCNIDNMFQRQSKSTSRRLSYLERPVANDVSEILSEVCFDVVLRLSDRDVFIDLTLV
jgi:hypothetical protein